MELRKPLTPFWFEHEGARFHLRPLTGPEFSEVLLSMEHQGEYVIGPGVRKCFELGLIGWEGVTENGVPVPFSRQAATRLHWRVITAIGDEVFRVSDTSEPEEKNSASPSRSDGGPTSSGANGAPGDGTATRATRRRSPSGASRA